MLNWVYTTKLKMQGFAIKQLEIVIKGEWEDIKNNAEC